MIYINPQDTCSAHEKHTIPSAKDIFQEKQEPVIVLKDDEQQVEDANDTRIDLKFQMLLEKVDQF